jgi:hypothetical protein
MSAVNDKSQVIGEFLEWLQNEKSVELCVRNDLSDQLMPFRFSTEELLAEFFEIDLKEGEKEKRQMLENLRGKK